MTTKKSLSFRLLGLTILIVLTMSAAMMLVISQLYQVRIHQEYENRGQAAARMVTCLLDGETVDRYLDSLEKDESYRQMLDHLRTLQRENGFKYVYVLRPVEDGSIYVFDTDEEDPVGLGEFFSWVDDWGEGFGDYYWSLRRGERVEPVITKSEKWGTLLTIYEPIVRADGSVAAYAGVDIAMERIFQERLYALAALGIAIPLLIIVFSTLHHFAISRIVLSPVSTLAEEVSAYVTERPGEAQPAIEDAEAASKQPPVPRPDDDFEVLQLAFADMKSLIDTALQELKKAEEHTRLMLDTTPLCCHVWDSNFRIVDCSEAALKLYGFDNKREFLERFFELSPEYQPDGRPSREKALACVKKAFEDGGHIFDWMHQMPDGTPMPTEVTLVRIDHQDGRIVTGYTRDLRHIKKMEKSILRLETEADKAYYDALTGLHNRRFFDLRLKRTIKSLSRSGSPLGLMMIDIDHFKEYNDTYGHTQGDACLKKVAAVLKSSVTRTGDFVARYGGEEFVVVLPNTGEKGARLMAGRLLENVRNCKILHEKSAVAAWVTVSIGVTTGLTKHTHHPDDYVKRADEMLYQSKQDGRNRYNFKSL